jgi:hypothetical protein
MNEQQKAAKAEHIERTIRMCALLTHHTGELRHLAKEMGSVPKVFRYWINRGRVPRVKAQWLESRFGKDVANAESLIA